MRIVLATLKRFTVAAIQGQTMWDNRNEVAGVYAVELVRGGRTLEVLRVVIKP